MMRIITIIAALAIAGIVFFWYTSPTYAVIQGLRTEVARFDDALDKSRELQQLKSSLLSRYNTIPTAQLDRLRKLLPDHVDNVRLVLDLDSMAQRHGMALQNVVISRDDGEENATVLGEISSEQSAVGTLVLQFATQATYQDFTAFLTDLESSLRIVDLVSLTLEPVSAPPGATEPVYGYNVSVRTYWLK